MTDSSSDAAFTTSMSSPDASSRADKPTVLDILKNFLDDLGREDLKRFRSKLSDFRYNNKDPIGRGRLEGADPVDISQRLVDYYGERNALDVTSQVLQLIGLMGLVEKLQEKLKSCSFGLNPSEEVNECRRNYLDFVKNQHKRIQHKNGRMGENVNMETIYTNLLLIKTQRDEEEREQEISGLGREHLEMMEQRRSDKYSPTTVDKLFDPEEDGFTPKTVVLQGPAGIGKTMTAQKIMLDWASGKLYEERFNYVFYLSCREINRMTGETSIADFISKMCRLKCSQSAMESILRDPEKILFLIDGLDELDQSFMGLSEDCSHPFQVVPKEVILSSLIRKQVLETSSLIITTRPFSLEKLNEYIECPRYVEILGFTGQERENYFFNFFENKAEAEAALNAIKENAALFTMCAVPLISWIVCTVLKQEIKKTFNVTRYKTSTSVYTLYWKGLLKYHSRTSNVPIKSYMKKLCDLAKKGVWSRKIIFEKGDLEEYGCDLSEEESLFLNENVFERDIEKQTCYSFIHLSVQEFFAALYYALDEQSDPNRHKEEVRRLLEKSERHEHVKVTVQFLFGLCWENQINEIAKSVGCKMSSGLKPILEEWMKKRISTASDRKEILCYLYETQDTTFVKRMMPDLMHLKIRSVFAYDDETLLVQAVAYCLENSEKVHTVTFSHYNLTHKAMKTLSKSFCKCSEITLWHCLLTSSCCDVLRDVIITNRSLTKLDLSGNNLQDSGVKLLCEGLQDPDCTLQELRLCDCHLTSSCCEDLRDVIITNRSLTKLDLSMNNLQDSGVKLLYEGLRHPDCTLQELRLCDCHLTSSCCEDLRDVIITNRSLTKLDLSMNNLQDSGVKLLYEGLRHPDCTLQELRLCICDLTLSCCEVLRDVIIRNRSLTKLDLSENNLQVSGVKLLREGLRRPDCTLRDLRLWHCLLTSSCCEILRFVIITNRSLTKLDLSGNNLQDSGVKLLCEVLQNPFCTLRDLRLYRCDLTSSCCEDLRVVIIRNRYLTKLDLSYNNLQDAGVNLLYEGLRRPYCTLRELGLSRCGLTSSCCEVLRDVIIRNRSLTKLDLSGNNLQDSGVNLLCEGLRHSDCTLQDLGLYDCGLTSFCCEVLRDVIITNRSLTKLDLSMNNLQVSGVKLLYEGLRHPDRTLHDVWLLHCNLTSSCCEDL
ncbi:NACHT, LRR and PYD domains-containing protein 3-like isoform X2 [Spea bombifrons]|uniref:NACHT, LRR and PYD domains-containing protein 3-like isoform X2 n=1 Tax=Spea bombifrons TaxID=233779 RepID=UPI00234AEA05|nr:NACHT, LRR and PYD domains-containing protein 3-like isoform X2 [Spea bombifrons]